MTFTIISPRIGIDPTHHAERTDFLRWDEGDARRANKLLTTIDNLNAGRGDFSTWIIDSKETALAFIKRFPGSQIVSSEGEESDANKWLVILGDPT